MQRNVVLYVMQSFFFSLSLIFFSFLHDDDRLGLAAAEITNERKNIVCIGIPLQSGQPYTERNEQRFSLQVTIGTPVSVRIADLTHNLSCLLTTAV